jgi:glycosyltransferase involved in cell wall biosynthesis
MPFIQNKIFKKVDFIKTNQMDGSWAAVIAKKIFNKKLIVRCGYEWLSFIILGKRSRFKIIIAYIVEFISYKSADHIIITSASDKDFIVSKFNINPNKISVISNYIDIDLFKPKDKEIKTKSIFFVGRIELQKNLAFLVESLAGLDVELIIAGEGSLKEEIQKLAQDHGVRITFLGNVSQKMIPDLISKSKIFGLTSLYEGNPKALLEAMSCGASIVATRVSGIDSVIDDGVDGLLVSLGDHTDIREKIIKILNNEVFANNLGLNARKKILENCSLDFVFNNEKSIYEILR